MWRSTARCSTATATASAPGRSCLATNRRTIARELVATVPRNTTIDWTEKESVRARLRVMVKRVLKHHKYPPDKQDQAVKTVLEQVTLLSAEWVKEPSQELLDEPADVGAYPLPADATALPRAAKGPQKPTIGSGL